MCEWTNVHDIMQDLSFAQGFVPASIEAFGSTRPPALNIEEETEEEFYESAGGGDFEKPDCNLIQKMLSMVKEKEPDKKNVIVKSELNPLSEDFVPKKIQKKLKRNVAMSSILSAQEKERTMKCQVPSMFKRKVLNNDSDTKSESESVSSASTCSPHKNNQYIPSSTADEYYSKYLEKSRVKDQLAKDIWTKAEQEMKMLEIKKNQKKDVSSKDNAFEFLILPGHRHELSEDCVVCEMGAKHGYMF